MIYLDDLRNATGGQLFGEAVASTFTGISYEITQVQPGHLFVAARLQSGDGHRLINAAISLGASGVLCEEPPDADVSLTTVVLVGDSVAALGQWAAYILRRYGTTVVVVMGALGKSAACATIASVLSARYTVFLQERTGVGRIALHSSLQGLTSEHQIAVLELAVNDPEELPELLAIVRPHVCVVTNSSGYEDNSSMDPLADWMDFENLIRLLPGDGTLVINFDDNRLRSLLHDSLRPVLTFGLSEGEIATEAVVQAYNTHLLLDRVDFDLKYQRERIRGNSTSLPGKPGLYAALAALTVGLLFEVPLSVALQSIRSLEPLPGQLKSYLASNGAIVVDSTYNTRMLAVEAGIFWIKEVTPDESRRKIVVLDDIEASIEQVEQVHYAVGQQIATFADFLIARGDLAQIAGMAAIHAGMPSERLIAVYRLNDIPGLLTYLTEAGDIVLIAGGAPYQGTRLAEMIGQGSSQSLTTLARRLPKSPRAATWIELDLDSLVRNLQELRRHLSPGVKVMAIVTANAYGHGFQQIASTAALNGVDMLGVSTLDEGLALRRAGISLPVLVLGYMPQGGIAEAARAGLSISLFSEEMVGSAIQVARTSSEAIRVHLNIDTGLGLLGISPSEVIPLVRRLIRSEKIQLDGLFSQFAGADNLFSVSLSREQIAEFRSVLESLKATGITIPYIHMANSAALRSLQESHFTMVRVGTSLYGLQASTDFPNPPGVQPVLSWKTSVLQVKTVRKGRNIGYGNSYYAKEDEKIAIIPVGFGSGLRAAPRNWGEVLVRGQRAPIIGRVGMSHSALLVTHVEGVTTGDEVVLIGIQGSEVLAAEDVARRLDCSNLEVLALIPPSVPRIIL